MDELVKAFNSTSKFERKLKIVTLSPYTINKTVEVFNTTHYLVKKVNT